MVRDHIGNEYKDIPTMCRAYGIRPGTYYMRLKRGAAQEDALSRPARAYAGSTKGALPCTDHLGHAYPSQAKMCAAYGCSQVTYHTRIRRGWTVEEALTGMQK